MFLKFLPKLFVLHRKYQFCDVSMISSAGIHWQLCFFEHIPIVKIISAHNHAFLTQYIPSFRRIFSVKIFKFPETLRTISRSVLRLPWSTVLPTVSLSHSVCLVVNYEMQIILSIMRKTALSSTVFVFKYFNEIS